ncbi:MAG: HAD-IA family hydrolase [Pseudomonadota bacterium]|nr:HAD-IA family hydrolase [Pseudomonadota bacterium]
MKLPFEFSTAIFDLDGTLVDTEPFYSEATQIVLEPYGKEFTKDFKRKIMGGDALTGASMIVEKFDLKMTPREFLEKREKHLRALFPSATEIKGAGEYLHRLKVARTRIALATSSSKTLCEIKIGHRAWSNIFECKIYGDDPELLRSKPAPDIFILCAQRMAVSPENIIFFEDSKNGIQAAKGAGMKVVGIRNEFMSEADFEDADFLVDNYYDIEL